MAGEVSRLYEYVLSGSRGRSRQEVAVSAGGVIGDRLLVVYDADSPSPHSRVSQAQLRDLAQFEALLGDHGSIHLTRNGRDLGIPGLVIDSSDEPDVIVDEFSDPTPGIDMGDEVAQRMQEELGRDNLRVAQKLVSWQMGHGISPSERMNAPMHVVTESSVAYVNELQRKKKIAPTGHDRYRPSIVLKTDSDPLAENSWEEIVAGGIVLRKRPVNGVTKRCNVPGNNQRTGEKMKDVPRIYKELPQSPDKKTLFGIYMYPVMDPGEVYYIQEGDRFEVVG